MNEIEDGKNGEIYGRKEKGIFLMT